MVLLPSEPVSFDKPAASGDSKILFGALRAFKHVFDDGEARMFRRHVIPRLDIGARGVDVVYVLLAGVHWVCLLQEAA